MEMRAGTPCRGAGFGVPCPVVRSLALANHRLITSTPPVCVEPASQLGASALGLQVQAGNAFSPFRRRGDDYGEPAERERFVRNLFDRTVPVHPGAGSTGPSPKRSRAATRLAPTSQLR